jgi:hypothetical protein
MERPVDLAHRQITEIAQNEFGADPEFGVFGKTSPEQLFYGVNLAKTGSKKGTSFWVQKGALFGILALFGPPLLIDLGMIVSLGVRKTRRR